MLSCLLTTTPPAFFMFLSSLFLSCLDAFSPQQVIPKVKTLINSSWTSKDLSFLKQVWMGKKKASPTRDGEETRHLQQLRDGEEMRHLQQEMGKRLDISNKRRGRDKTSPTRDGEETRHLQQETGKRRDISNKRRERDDKTSPTRDGEETRHLQQEAEKRHLQQETGKRRDISNKRRGRDKTSPTCNGEDRTIHE